MQSVANLSFRILLRTSGINPLYLLGYVDEILNTHRSKLTEAELAQLRMLRKLLTGKRNHEGVFVASQHLSVVLTEIGLDRTILVSCLKAQIGKDKLKNDKQRPTLKQDQYCFRKEVLAYIELFVMLIENNQ